jgi:hypothetical protein
MTSPTVIRRALVAALPGLDAQVTPSAIDYSQGAGMDVQRFNVRIVVGRDGDAAQERLDELIAAAGVKALLEADRTLGGLVADVAVVKCTGYQLFPPADVLGATWTVAVR